MTTMADKPVAIAEPGLDSGDEAKEHVLASSPEPSGK